MVRVAVEGCGHGTLHAIYSSISKSCEINGWDGVDLLIIGGDFQAVRNSYDLNCMSVPMKFWQIGDFHEYYSGARRAPYLTIFVGGNHEASNHLFELYYGGWVAPNIYYLGAANVLRFGPLRIAALSGIWKGYNYNKSHHERLPYNQDEIKSIYHVRELDVRKLLQIRAQVDIGISHDWPRGVEWMGNWRALFAKKDLFEADARAGTLGSQAAKYVLDRLRPPYWFAAHLHCKYSATILHKPANENILPMSDRPSATIETILPLKYISEPGLTSVQRNTDEIDLDMEANDEQQQPAMDSTFAADVDGGDDQRESVKADEPVVPEDLRSQLPVSFARKAVHSASIQDTPMPNHIFNTTTRFLALDKCLPQRKFLQFLEIESVAKHHNLPSTQPYVLSYDKEWLAITRVFASDLILGNAAALVPPNQGETLYRNAIESEEAWVEERLVQKDKMAIPQNFQLTAPVYDATIGIGTRKQPKEYTNAQTTEFCDMLKIPCPFQMSEENRSERMRVGPREEAHRRGGRSAGRSGRDRGRERGKGRS
ncbi:hypothetical protein MMC13_001178 [Lambiella insularis]|nr:hypothetical protein [Lambiella insularis]